MHQTQGAPPTAGAICGSQLTPLAAWQPASLACWRNTVARTTAPSRTRGSSMLSTQQASRLTCSGSMATSCPAPTPRHPRTGTPCSTRLATGTVWSLITSRLSRRKILERHLNGTRSWGYSTNRRATIEFTVYTFTSPCLYDRRRETNYEPFPTGG